MKPLPILLVTLVVVGAIALLFFSRRRTAYWNPIDSTNYIADWRPYRPDTLREQQGRTALVHVRLLSEQAAFEREIGVDPLAELCRSIEESVRGVTEAGTASYDLLVETALSAQVQPRYQLATRGQAPDEELQRIHDALSALRPVNTRRSELKFQMLFRIGPRAD